MMERGEKMEGCSDGGADRRVKDDGGNSLSRAASALCSIHIRLRNIPAHARQLVHERGIPTKTARGNGMLFIHKPCLRQNHHYSHQGDYSASYGGNGSRTGCQMGQKEAFDASVKDNLIVISNDVRAL